MCPVFAFLLDDPLMILVLGAIAVMLFGERLPEVARSFGKGLMELRNGIHGLQRELEDAVNSATSTPPVSLTHETEEPEAATQNVILSEAKDLGNREDSSLRSE